MPSFRHAHLRRLAALMADPIGVRETRRAIERLNQAAGTGNTIARLVHDLVDARANAARWRRRALTAEGQAVRLRGDVADLEDFIAGERTVHEATLAEVERLRAGEADIPKTDTGRQPTPAEWIRHWNDATPEKRLEVARDVIAALRTEERCVSENHSGRLETQRTRAQTAEDTVQRLFDRARLLFPDHPEWRHLSAMGGLEQMEEIIRNVIGMVVNPAYVDTLPQAEDVELLAAHQQEASLLDRLARHTLLNGPAAAAGRAFGADAGDVTAFDQWVREAVDAYHQAPRNAAGTIPVDELLGYILARVLPAILEHARPTANAPAAVPGVDDETRAAVLAWLEQRADEWQRDGGLSRTPAPTPVGDVIEQSWFTYTPGALFGVDDGTVVFKARLTDGTEVSAPPRTVPHAALIEARA